MSAEAGKLRRTRLRGHALQSEGKPYTQRPSGGWERLNGIWGGGAGHALCECGEASPELTSDGQRKRWHRDIHKPEVWSRLEMPR